MSERTLQGYTRHLDDCAKRTKCRYCSLGRYEHGHMHSFEADKAAACTCGLDALLASLSSGESERHEEQKNDSNAALAEVVEVGQTVPAPREVRKEWVAPEGYWAYHELVVAAVRKRLLAQFGHPTTFALRVGLAKAVEFFDVQCTYDAEFAEGADPDDVAESNIESADWS